jgi:hypothetical protein
MYMTGSHGVAVRHVSKVSDESSSHMWTCGTWDAIQYEYQLRWCHCRVQHTLHYHLKFCGLFLYIPCKTWNLKRHGTEAHHANRGCHQRASSGCRRLMQARQWRPQHDALQHQLLDTESTMLLLRNLLF